MKLNTAPGETWIVLSTGGCTVTTGAGKQIKKLAAGQDFFTAMTGETILSDDNAIATVAKGEMLSLLNLTGSGSDVQATLRFQPVTSQSALPATGEDGVIYLVPKGAGAPNQYTEWVWTGAAYEQLGDAGVDLSGYVSKEDLGITEIVDEETGPLVRSNAALVTNTTYADNVVTTGGAVITNRIRMTPTAPDVVDPDTLEGIDIVCNGGDELRIEVSAMIKLEDSTVNVGKLCLGSDDTYCLDDSGDGCLRNLSVMGELNLNSGARISGPGWDETIAQGEPVSAVSTSTITIRHATWFDNTTQSSITVQPGTWNNRVMTCYLKTAVPVELSGVTWLYDAPTMAEGYTYVIALQQLDATTILANPAYTF